MTADEKRLIDAASQARANAHAPYSGYRVGAAVVDENGNLHTGCNVENASFPEGICAETNAIGAMVAAGGKRIVAIAVAGGPDEIEIETCTPCGGCRQRILEFAGEDTRVLLPGPGNEISRYTIKELLPNAFRL